MFDGNSTSAFVMFTSKANKVYTLDFAWSTDRTLPCWVCLFFKVPDPDDDGALPCWVCLLFMTVVQCEVEIPDPDDDGALPCWVRLLFMAVRVTLKNNSHHKLRSKVLPRVYNKEGERVSYCALETQNPKSHDRKHLKTAVLHNTICLPQIRVRWPGRC